ncbi:MAG TPA: YibE/F family protein [Firmicutes bacterium]|nr:YibE/F family protein [Bacillota bacterium]
MNAKKKVTKRQVLAWGLMCLVAVAFAVFLWQFNQIEKTPLVSTEGRTFEKATVVSVLRDNLQEDGNRYGDQQVELQINTGELAGQVVEATSPNGNLFGAVCYPGRDVIAIVSISGDNHVVTVYSPDRTLAVAGFIIIFLLLLSLLGGMHGLKSAFGLIFTFVCIFFLMLPMIYMGVSPVLSAILISLITTLMTMYLIGGFSAKTFCAVVGTLAGVILAGVSAWLFGMTADIGGYNVSNIEDLVFLGQNTPVKIGELLFAGILISALGAVTDVAMSISSTICEIHTQSPHLSRWQLFRSGMTVGRDVMATMADTLVMAFAGSSLSMLVLNYAYDLSMNQILNSSSIGIEIMQAVSGSIGIVMSVPLVSFLAASLVPAWENHKLKKHHSAPVLEESPAESPEQEELEDLEDSTEE